SREASGSSRCLAAFIMQESLIKNKAQSGHSTLCALFMIQGIPCLVDELFYDVVRAVLHADYIIWLSRLAAFFQLCTVSSDMLGAFFPSLPRFLRLPTNKHYDLFVTATSFLH